MTPAGSSVSQCKPGGRGDSREACHGGVTGQNAKWDYRDALAVKRFIEGADVQAGKAGATTGAGTVEYEKGPA